jgi:hypothetical protein
MTGSAGGEDDVVAKGVEALQSAAQEMIAAARAMLDVADELVRDPRAAGTVVEAMSSFARRQANRAASSPPGRPGGGDDDEDGDGSGGVQRIPVS